MNTSNQENNTEIQNKVSILIDNNNQSLSDKSTDMSAIPPNYNVASLRNELEKAINDPHLLRRSSVQTESSRQQIPNLPVKSPIPIDNNNQSLRDKFKLEEQQLAIIMPGKQPSSSEFNETESQLIAYDTKRRHSTTDINFYFERYHTNLMRKHSVNQHMPSLSHTQQYYNAYHNIGHQPGQPLLTRQTALGHRQLYQLSTDPDENQALSFNESEGPSDYKSLDKRRRFSAPSFIFPEMGEQDNVISQKNESEKASNRSYLLQQSSAQTESSSQQILNLPVTPPIPSISSAKEKATINTDSSATVSQSNIPTDKPPSKLEAEDNSKYLLAKKRAAEFDRFVNRYGQLYNHCLPGPKQKTSTDNSTNDNAVVTREKYDRLTNQYGDLYRHFLPVRKPKTSTDNSTNDNVVATKGNKP